MRNTFDRKKTVRYCLWVYAIGWALQIAASIVTLRVSAAAGRLVIMAAMAAPVLAVLLAGQPLSGMGWKPRVKANIRWILIAWFLPALLTLLGAGLYFLLFPAHLDLSGAALSALAGTDVLDQLAAQGFTLEQYLGISAVSVLTFAPFVNILPALGEEIGWRGFLSPQLQARFGRRKGRLLSGVIWGTWHWPLIVLIGYEYGTGYVGFPVTGMLLFCVFTAAMGILADWVYEKSGSIWLPSLLHGAINAAAALPLYVCAAEGSSRLLGAAPNGLIAGIPLFLAACAILAKDRE